MENEGGSSTYARTVLSIVLAFIALGIVTGNDVHPVASQDRDTRARAQAALRDNTARLMLSPDLNDLRERDIREGLSGQHVSYQQTLNGLPLFGSYVTVSLPKQPGEEPVIRSRYLPDARGPKPQASLTAAEALDYALQSLGSNAELLRGAPSLQLAYSRQSKDMALVWEVILPTVDPLGSWLLLVDANSGEIRYKHNLIRQDSGQVFDPNPAMTNGGTAPAPNCDSAGNETLLAGQYVSKTLQGIEDGQDQLKGRYADLTATGISGGYKAAGQANEPSRDYVYPCTDDRFEEVMAYFHVDATQRKLQSLGFFGQSAVLDRPVPIHAHYMSSCNAFFDPVNRGLHFGDSDSPSCGSFNTDTAEDADVIVHEYGHAIQDDQVPGWAFGPYPQAEEAASMGEGFSDFLTGAVFGDPCLGEYVNFGYSTCGGSPGLRWLQNTRDYPAGFEACPDVDYDGDTVPESEEPHCGGEVWGGVLWDLAENLGGGTTTQASRDLVLQLVMDAQYYLDPVATFDEAAATICFVDTLLYGGAHVADITSTFSARGISTDSCAASDSPVLYLRILHTYSGDLDINVKVGSDVDAPICQFIIQDGSIAGPGSLVGYLELDASTCSDQLPPTASQPWWLEVRDAAVFDTGTIDNFEISFVDGTLCFATDVPVSIPDATGPPPSPTPSAWVYSKVDCLAQAIPCDAADADNDTISNCVDNCPTVPNADQTNTDADLAAGGAGMGASNPPPTLPGDASGDACDDDDDNDGYADSLEQFLGTNQVDNCAGAPGPGGDAWPPDFNVDAEVNIIDIGELRPVFDSQQGDGTYEARFDLSTDLSINVIDVGELRPVFGHSCT